MEPNESKAVVIQGVPPLAWGQGKDCTFVGALEAAMAVTKHPYSYAALMGLSGLAFRVRWCNEATATKWCGSCPIGEMPDEYRALEAHTGWSFPTALQFGVQNPDHVAIRERLVHAIDAERPVLAYAATLDVAVVYGYEDGGNTLFVRDYSQQEDPFKVSLEDLGPMQTYLGAYTVPPSRRETLSGALTIAVQNWHRERHDGGVEGREYWYGEAAFKAWMGDLRKFESLPDDARASMFGLDRWNLVSLYDARKAAVAFLEDAEAIMDGEAREALESAADHYRHIVALLVPVLAAKENVQDVGDWSEADRLSEAEVLAEVYQFESKAIADLALAVERLRPRKTAPNVLSSHGEQRVILKGVDRYRVMDPLFECVRVALAHRGERWSAPYIQGISGAAFRIGGICPCAPTCACAMDTQDLITWLGYEMDHLPLFGEDVDLETERPKVLARVKDEIRAGRPAILWHAFTTCEWDVVAGFDDERQQFFGRGSYAGLEEAYAVADQARTTTCTAICPALGAILIGDKVRDFDAREAELAALQEAVRHAHSPIPNAHEESTTDPDDGGGAPWVMLDGLACYDRWVRDFKADPPKLPSMGDRYCFGVYRSTHRAAAAFMRELMPKYPEAQAPLERASGHFVAEADALHEAAELLFPEWRLPERPSVEKNARAAVLLSVARDNYARAIDEIEKVLRAVSA